MTSAGEGGYFNFALTRKVVLIYPNTKLKEAAIHESEDSIASTKNTLANNGSHVAKPVRN